MGDRAAGLFFSFSSSFFFSFYCSAENTASFARCTFLSRDLAAQPSISPSILSLCSSSPLINRVRWWWHAAACLHASLPAAPRAASSLFHPLWDPLPPSSSFSRSSLHWLLDSPPPTLPPSHLVLEKDLHAHKQTRQTKWCPKVTSPCWPSPLHPPKGPLPPAYKDPLKTPSPPRSSDMPCP